jgi:hypothetical protein
MVIGQDNILSPAIVRPHDPSFFQYPDYTGRNGVGKLIANGAVQLLSWVKREFGLNPQARQRNVDRACGSIRH